MHRGAADVVSVCAEPDFPAWFKVVHVVDRAASTKNFAAADKFFRLCVKSDEAIRGDTGLYQPDAIVAVDGHAIWPTVGSMWQRPLGEFAAGRIIAANFAEGVVSVPDIAVRGDTESAGTGILAGQCYFGEGQVLCIDPEKFIAAEFDRPRYVVAIDYNAVGP